MRAAPAFVLCALMFVYGVWLPVATLRALGYL